MNRLQSLSRVCKGAMLIAGGTILFSGAVQAAGSRAELDRVKAEAKQQYETAAGRCKSLAGNTQDICEAKAKAERTAQEAIAEANFKGTDKAAYDARVDIAKANYDLAKERCDDKSGNDKDVCRKDAEAAYVVAKEDAKLALKTHKLIDKAADKESKAQYNAAAERCDTFTGDAKDACVAKAKVDYGR